MQQGDIVDSDHPPDSETEEEDNSQRPEEKHMGPLTPAIKEDHNICPELDMETAQAVQSLTQDSEQGEALSGLRWRLRRPATAYRGMFMLSRALR